MEEAKQNNKNRRLAKAFDIAPAEEAPAPVAPPASVVGAHTAAPLLTLPKRERTYGTTVSFRVDAHLAERLERISHELRWSKTEIIIELLKKALPLVEKQHGITP